MDDGYALISEMVECTKVLACTAWRYATWSEAKAQNGRILALTARSKALRNKK